MNLFLVVVLCIKTLFLCVLILFLLRCLFMTCVYWLNPEVFCSVLRLLTCDPPLSFLLDVTE